MIFLTRERNIEEARAAILRTGQTEQFLTEQSSQPYQWPLQARLQETGQTGDLRRGENSQVSQWIPRGYTGGETAHQPITNLYINKFHPILKGLNPKT